jgi:hypothetical protein
MILAFMAVVISLSSGCSVNRATATLDPTADLDSIETIYVTKFAPDGRGINLLIADKLKTMGYSVETGIAAPEDVDVVVTYKDKWMWDITMYMLELTVTLRDPKTNFPLASGNSFHTSLSRKSPEEMVDEVINNIFKQGSEHAQK